MRYKTFLNPLKIAGVNPSYDNANIIFLRKQKNLKVIFFKRINKIIYLHYKLNLIT